MLNRRRGSNARKRTINLLTSGWTRHDSPLGLTDEVVITLLLQELNYSPTSVNAKGVVKAASPVDKTRLLAIGPSSALNCLDIR